MTERMTAEEFREESHPSERELQEAIIEWAWHQPGPASLLYAVPNGQYRKGERPEAGLKSGIPDLCLPVPRGGSGALYLELKVGGRTTTDAQDERIMELRGAGNRVAVVRQLDKAIETIETYLQEPQH